MYIFLCLAASTLIVVTAELEYFQTIFQSFIDNDVNLAHGFHVIAYNFDQVLIDRLNRLNGMIV